MSAHDDRPTRRAVLAGGCVSVALMALPKGAGAWPLGHPAPRPRCPHTGCRFQRPGLQGEGICGLTLHGPAMKEEKLP